MRKAVKRLVTLGTAVCLMVSSSIVSFAGEWKQDTVGWWYVNDDGHYPSNVWQEIDGKHYYFGADGYLLVNTTTPDGYKVGTDGAWIPDSVSEEIYINPELFIDFKLTFGELREKYNNDIKVGGPVSYFVGGSDNAQVVNFINSSLTGKDSGYYFTRDNEVGAASQAAIDEAIAQTQNYELLLSTPLAINDGSRPIAIMVGEDSIKMAKESYSVDEFVNIIKGYGATNLRIIDKEIPYTYHHLNGKVTDKSTHPTYVRFVINGVWFYAGSANGNGRINEIRKFVFSNKCENLEKGFNENTYYHGDVYEKTYNWV